MSLTSRQLPADVDVLAPDGSEIRLLVATARGSLVHCRLPAGRCSLAVAHHTVEEVWYCLSGRGQLWRRLGDEAVTLDLTPGVAATIPTGAHFQFRAAADQALEVVITTMPPWPGADEAYRVADHWPVKAD